MAENENDFTLTDEEQKLSRVEKLRRYHEARPPVPRGQAPTQGMTDDELERFEAMSPKQKLDYLRGYKGPAWSRPKDAS